MVADMVMVSSFSHVPRWRNVNHFESVTNVTFTDASKYEDISKVCRVTNIPMLTVFPLLTAKQFIVPASASVLTKTASAAGYALLRAIRVWVEMDMYVSFEVQTEDRLSAFEQLLIDFEKRIEVSCTHIQ